MFDTYITVVGTVLTRPDWKLLTKTNSVVASFRVASNSRRYDRNSEQWVDGPSLRVRVNCWRNLADGVKNSIGVGDPVVVYGRIATRDWKNEDGEARIAYEVEAVTVGHDLSRGMAEFQRRKHDPSSVIEDADSEARINGELAETIPSLDAPRSGAVNGATGEHFQVETFPESDTSGPSDTDLDALSILRNAGLEPSDAQTEDDDGEPEESTDTGTGGSGGRRRRGRQPVPA
jgi:single-strand DNA-binding protein